MTILTTETLRTISDSYIVAFMVAAVISFFIAIAIKLSRPKISILILAPFTILFAELVTALIIWITPTFSWTFNQYTALIEDNSPIQEIVENYDIVSVEIVNDHYIYTLRDKDWDISPTKR